MEKHLTTVQETVCTNNEVEPLIDLIRRIEIVKYVQIHLVAPVSRRLHSSKVGRPTSEGGSQGSFIRLSGLFSLKQVLFLNESIVISASSKNKVKIIESQLKKMYIVGNFV